MSRLNCVMDVWLLQRSAAAIFCYGVQMTALVSRVLVSIYCFEGNPAVLHLDGELFFLNHL